MVREFCGHGIGRKFHEEPQVLHYGKPGVGVALEPGMTFTVEPMINAGKPGIRELADGWTIVTKDHSLSAQWEHTVAVTETGYEVLTKSAGSMAPAMLVDLRDEVAEERQALREAYLRQPNPRAARQAHAARRPHRPAVWRAMALEGAALVATGGYGRGELYPARTSIFSCCSPRRADGDAKARALIGRLWDIGLEIGHSVRTVEECVRGGGGHHHPHHAAGVALPCRRQPRRFSAGREAGSQRDPVRSSRRRSSSRSSATPSTRTRPTRSSRT